MEGGAAPAMPLFSFATHSGHRRSLYILGGGGQVTGVYVPLTFFWEAIHCMEP